VEKSKCQTPNLREISNFNPQGSEKSQNPKARESMVPADIGVGASKLEALWDLELGVWFLV
jgi:hypothetical protein